MKKLFIILSLTASLAAQATIEDEGQPTSLSTAEITRNRACFEELTRENCPDPSDDARQFRACLHNSFDALTPSCQKLMSELYSGGN